MTHSPCIRLYQLACGLLLLSTITAGAVAQPLDDVRLEFQDRGVVATIRLTGLVQYLRHFPESHGKTLEIYYDHVQGERSTLADKNVVAGEVQPKKDVVSEEIWVDNEVRKSPPSGLIPSFTVTTRDQQTKPKLVIEFSREAEYSVAPGKDNRSLLITIIPDKRQVSTEPLPFLPTIKPEKIAAPTATLTADEAAAVESNKQARALMVQGRDALAAKNNEAAVEAFNKLLLLTNDYTQDVQEWIGVARERVGQIDKAKIEYDLYLRLYPEGAGAARVAQRVAGLSGKGMVPASAATTEERKKVARWTTFGSISSRYYFSYSKIETTSMFNSAPTTSSQSLTDQSMLITSLHASERYASEEYDGRLVFNDVNTRNFLANQPSQNRVSVAYGEIKNRSKDYMLRLGRQSSTGGGVLSRFDGLAASYGAELRINGVVGALSDFSQGSKPVFVGASVDKGPLSFYAINQRVDGVTDRRALGTEFRYFEGNNTAFALLDYDIYFKALNTAQLMGTVGALGGTMNFMIDHRKSPSLSIRNALYGASVSSVNALLRTNSASSLRELALTRTATSNMGQLGVSVPMLEKWQVGGDIRLTNTTGLPASGALNTDQGFVEAVPGRGIEKSVTGQIIGNGLYMVGDIWSGSVTFNTGNAANGHSIYLYNHILYASGWTMDTSLQLYRYKDQLGGVTKHVTPMVRGAYRLKEQLYVDVDGGFSLTNSDGAQSTSITTRYFYSVGLRWDF